MEGTRNYIKHKRRFHLELKENLIAVYQKLKDGSASPLFFLSFLEFNLESLVSGGHNTGGRYKSYQLNCVQCSQALV